VHSWSFVEDVRCFEDVEVGGVLILLDEEAEEDKQGVDALGELGGEVDGVLTPLIVEDDDDKAVEGVRNLADKFDEVRSFLVEEEADPL
jgi:hypothetical protein